MTRSPEIVVEGGSQADEEAERVAVGLPVDGHMVLALAWTGEREDLGRDVRPGARAAAGTARAEPHGLAEPLALAELALGDERRQVPHDRRRVEADGASATRDREHDDPALTRAHRDHEPPRRHARANAAASRAAATTGCSAGRCHRARR